MCIDWLIAQVVTSDICSNIGCIQSFRSSEADGTESEAWGGGDCCPREDDAESWSQSGSNNGNNSNTHN